MDPLPPNAPESAALGRRFRVHGERRIGARTTLLEADDTETRSPVRVELFDVSGAHGAELIKDFRTRLRAFEGIEHPALSPVLSGGMRGSGAYTVTEPHHGVWVGDLVGERFRERVSRREALDIADVLLGALETLHEQDLVHGHIGPRTLSLADDGGVSLLLLATPPPSGTGGAAFGPQDDVAAVAELLETMVAGHSPEHDGDSPAGRDAVGEAISALVAQGTDPDPRRRPADASVYRALVRRATDALPAAAGRHVARSEPLEEEHPRDEPEPAPRRRIMLWAALAAVLVLVGGVALWAVTNQGSAPAGARMPDLVGLSPSEAADQLAELPVSPEISYENVRSDDVEAGLIASTSPESGGELSEGADVRLSVAAGPLTVLMPEVVDSPEQDARLALSEAGLTDVEIVQEPAEGLPAGTVTDSDPEEGEQVPYDSTVVLTVVEGVIVPDLVGSSEEEAVGALAELGLESAVEEAEDSERPEGEVDHHSPGSGSVVEEGALVVLGVSTGPEEDEDDDEEETEQEDDNPRAEGDRDEGHTAAAPPDQNQPDEPEQVESEQPAPCTSGGWSQGGVYPEGSRVVHDGTEYEAVWWNSDSSPEESNEWGPWRPVSSC
ncbi:PASTA domain-containing protein [Nocardiopsis valliformis]|uniref:PASTA domain-containing protein n=1 Tax=Nocardiopsis valliformis TaxID=239974 RepID=UPI000373EC6D|nr:PASTA domain-containing protein [Nocardiopsis valliformis]